MAVAFAPGLPERTGRNFHEVLRVIDSLLLTANHKVATPANLEPGEDVYPQGWRAPRPDVRFVPQPRQA